MELFTFNKVGKVDPTQLQQNSSHPADEMLVAGKPKRTSKPLVDFEPWRPGVGFWEAEVGAWNFVYPSNRNEIFHVLEGTFSIESETTPRIEFTKGDTGIIPSGFSGTLRVYEAVRKMYVLLA
ncbi:DUF861 domain-containing protein [Paraburkholderia sprentiae WSM5005]|uniref:DUF861 domain-containing protein n=1 Tax=Paraburkholderia sprentiae WSM5005 TaxID=754502 RepID=A0A1I9YS39_9BURK|nr:cupin domain-containing protein [Paraburkholderia sprentiae]APA89029.1 DUF861 domain-containing protein [Paraburkholderia sprentiae WSM5005]